MGARAHTRRREGRAIRRMRRRVRRASEAFLALGSAATRAAGQMMAAFAAPVRATEKGDDQ